MSKVTVSKLPQGAFLLFLSPLVISSVALPDLWWHISPHLCPKGFTEWGVVRDGARGVKSSHHPSKVLPLLTHFLGC